MTRSFAWPFPMRATPWHEIRRSYVDLIAQRMGATYMIDVVDSVISSPHRGQLAAIISMWDLVVTTAPIPERPFEVVIVFGPGPQRAEPLDRVVIEQRPKLGPDWDRTVGPVGEAVPLFWQVMAEKFDIGPTNGKGATHAV